MLAAGVKEYEAFVHEILEAVTDHPISFEVFADEISEMERKRTKSPDGPRMFTSRSGDEHAT